MYNIYCSARWWRRILNDPCQFVVRCETIRQNNNKKERKKQKQRKIAAGLEPATFGSEDRCSAIEPDDRIVGTMTYLSMVYLKYR